MFIIFFYYIIFFNINIFAFDCPENFINIKDHCYYKKHIDVLQNFITLNSILKNMEPINIGYQEWVDGKLTYLYLGNSAIENLPDSLGLLKSLKKLDLRNNNISILPESLCNIHPFFTEINLSNNYICPPYPFCFDYIDNQNINFCLEFNCSPGFIKKNNQCYNKNHLIILQNIIDINPSLTNINPFSLGKNIGKVGWKNGLLIHLNLIGHNLTSIPESLCSIYENLEYFDVSNNSICLPYPNCFEYLGYQNVENCGVLNPKNQITNDNNIINSKSMFINHSLSISNFKYFQQDLSVIQSFIDNNSSIQEKNPLKLGQQQWKNLRLSGLDFSDLDIITIPESICTIFSNLKTFDLSNNQICPPYPDCINYINNQKNATCEFSICTDNYIEINNNCYKALHLNFIKDFIESNPFSSDTFQTTQPVNISNNHGFQKWQNGQLQSLILTNKDLLKIPETICEIINEIPLFNFYKSNNLIYPSCIEKFALLDFDNYNFPDESNLNCQAGYIAFDDYCYNNNDLDVLMKFIKINPALSTYPPLLLGYQEWKNGRIIHLNLEELNIASIPEDIIYLNQLKSLNLNNNNISILPSGFCNLYDELISFEINNNNLCSPYLECFDFIGNQNTKNCNSSMCIDEYLEINQKCYYKKDLEVLESFINTNDALKNMNPLKIGIQKWVNMRLNYLYLGNNELTTIPKSICTISSSLKGFNFSKNNICPPYPECIETLMGEQNTSSCP